jgi:hypothetical protein
MSRVKFKLNGAGVRDLLKSDGVVSECQKHAQATYAAASASAEGYVLEERNYPERKGYAVYAADYPAIADNLKNNTLLKSLQ